MVCPSALTLLVRGGARMSTRGSYGNASDDLVEDYKYDFYYVNDKPLAEISSDFLPFMGKMLGRE